MQSLYGCLTEMFSSWRAVIQSGCCSYYVEEICNDSFVMMLIWISCFPISLVAQMFFFFFFNHACSFPRDNASCPFNNQAERLKEQASCWEKEREGYMMTQGSRQPLTKVHCKIPYRTYERRRAPPWTRRVQRPAMVSDAEDDSDGSPPILTKAHQLLTAKRKVTFRIWLCDSSIPCTIITSITLQLDISPH